MLNVSSYLARIGYTGPTTPTEDVLRAIHRQHLLTVPFENLDIARATKIVCEEDAFLRKIVDPPSRRLLLRNERRFRRITAWAGI